jgi:hypothetical protein
MEVPFRKKRDGKRPSLRLKEFLPDRTARQSRTDPIGKYVLLFFLQRIIES